MSTPWFYVKYQAQHHIVIAYGAAAKGMVLLHFLLEILSRFTTDFYRNFTGWPRDFNRPNRTGLLFFNRFHLC